MLDRGTLLSIDQLVAIRDFHPSRSFRLYLGRTLVGADQWVVGISADHTPMPQSLLIGEPQAAGEHAYDDDRD